jgi:hypothetical protein
MDFPIPQNICPLVQANLLRLLDIAHGQGLMPTEFPGALYLAGGLDRHLSSSVSSAAAAPITGRRKNKVETQKVKKAAKIAKIRRGRNDTRQRLAAHTYRKVLHHEIEEIPHPNIGATEGVMDPDSGSDSDEQSRATSICAFRHMM